jgi:hypothetical protein
VLDPSSDQAPDTHRTLIFSPWLEESSDASLQFGRNIRIAERANRIESFAVGVQKGHTVGAALQMLVECHGGLGIQFRGYIIVNKGCQFFASHIYSPEALCRKIRLVAHPPGLPMHDVVATLVHILLFLRESSVTGRLSYEGWPQPRRREGGFEPGQMLATYRHQHLIQRQQQDRRAQ